MVMRTRRMVYGWTGTAKYSYNDGPNGHGINEAVNHESEKRPKDMLWNSMIMKNQYVHQFNVERSRAVQS